MGKAVTPFYDLFLSHRDLLPGEQQRAIEQEFPGVVARTALRWWSPDSGIPAGGTRLVIGVATYSGPDMRLLDLVQEAVTKEDARRMAGARVEVFSVMACKSHEDFDRYVPGIGQVFQTPVVGLWVNGTLGEKCWGAPARELVARVCGFDPSDVFRRTNPV
jgi:hypothetical protein